MTASPAKAPPIALTIAGSDSGGGAGIQADLKTFSALGVYGASVITALTAQNTLGVSAVHDVPPAFVRAQMDAVFSDLDVRAVKIGMVSRADVIRTIAEGLDAHGAGPVVVDPVMVAASGDSLLVPEAVAVLSEALVPRAFLLTPNLPEAARLSGQPVAETESEMIGQGERLLSLGARAVLMKGGHAGGAESADVLLTREAAPRWYRAPRHATTNTHGTGCTLSSAITAGLADGLPLGDAVAMAKDYLTAAIRAADVLQIGAGHGPVHHFHALWPSLRLSSRSSSHV
ncbi:hydroxymethylpyrimidine kinase /phosphomethylpyrimidine kinase [Pseudoxanthobacter soli DSM 19599]|uniref:hydroxymethylpyrimidine kinase n=1 Tax=Pseudoxanthobacter soli DSM 19599 TaxID=1123029 RepID=A0A1M7ZLW3_9HYPH|nr:bifunctional hydroxymethylpyrimidine kinase/phosphomethylpyrimidine kinase [Pseudoxanthobacter soli]SHO65877.1 hydroxymethylpyrimidine kinase /phosphomethylpyrimidine kinase [Pseudoxanthobacter soli DSM 19599]